MKRGSQMMSKRCTLLAAFTTTLLASILLPERAPAACVLTCPDDVRIVVANVEQSAKVDYSVTATGCGTIVQVQGLPSGSLFPVGTTTNGFAQDGSSPFCSFKVVVVTPGRPAPTASAAGLGTLAIMLCGFGIWAARRRARRLP